MCRRTFTLLQKYDKNFLPLKNISKIFRYFIFLSYSCGHCIVWLSKKRTFTQINKFLSLRSSRKEVWLWLGKNKSKVNEFLKDSNLNFFPLFFLLSSTAFSNSNSAHRTRQPTKNHWMAWHFLPPIYLLRVSPFMRVPCPSVCLMCFITPEWSRLT